MGCSSIPSFFVEKKALEADTCGTLSENVIANMRQHGPQFLRFARQSSPCRNLSSRYLWHCHGKCDSEQTSAWSPIDAHRYTQVFWIPSVFLTSTTDTRNKRIFLMAPQRGPTV